MIGEINELCDECGVHLNARNKAKPVNAPINVSLIFSLRHTHRPLLSVTVVYDNSIHLERKTCELDQDQANFIGVLPHFGEGLKISVRSTGCFVPSDSDNKNTGPALIDYVSSDDNGVLPICICDSRSTNVNNINYQIEFDVVKHAPSLKHSIVLNNPEFFRVVCNTRQKIMNLQHRISQLNQIPNQYKKYKSQQNDTLPKFGTAFELIVHVNTTIRSKLQDALQQLPVQAVSADVVNLFEHSKQNLWSPQKSYRVVSAECMKIPDNLLHEIYSLLGVLQNIESIDDSDVMKCAQMCLIEESEVAAFTKNHNLLQKMRAETLQKIEESRHSKKRVMLTSRGLFVLLRAIDNVICSNLHACFNIGFSKNTRSSDQCIELRAAFLRHKTCNLLLRQIFQNQHDDTSNVSPTFFDDMRVSMHKVQDMLHCLPNNRSTFLPCVARCLASATLKLICNKTNANAHMNLNRQNPGLYAKLRILPVATKLNFTYASRRSDVLFRRRDHSTSDVGDDDFHRNCMDMYLEIIHASHDTYDISRHVMLDAYNFLQTPESVLSNGVMTENFKQFRRIFTNSMQDFVTYVNAPTLIKFQNHVFEPDNPLFAFLNSSQVFANDHKIDYTLNTIVTLFKSTPNNPVMYDYEIVTTPAF